MSFKDMLSMSLSNLWRRKLRTFLTVLGVLIGTASIVGMLSLAIGMKEMIINSYSSFGSATQITIEQGYSGDTGEGGNGQNDATLLSESNQKMFAEMEHVTSVEPQLSIDIRIEQGKYVGWTSIMGVSQSVLKDQKVGEGKMPTASGGSMLNVLAGNSLVASFTDSTNPNDEGYYGNGKLPNVDLMKKHSRFLCDNPLASQQTDGGEDSDAEETVPETTQSPTTQADGSTQENSSSLPVIATPTTEAPVNNQPEMLNLNLNISGMMEGTVDDYSNYSQYLLTDIDDLKTFLSKNFRKGQIPGQPLNAKGRPYNQWIYSGFTVNVDKSENVDTVLQNIQDMGFQAQSNKEFIEQTQNTLKIIELVLGGIGMIAFLVAAIGIANTMMMSTYERTKEIGVMKVLGCDMRDIQKLFLSEAGFIGMIGGILGLIFTFGLAAVINYFGAASMAQSMGTGTGSGGKVCDITWWLALVAIVFSTLMGMLAGYFPARRAMKLSALAAIRNE